MDNKRFHKAIKAYKQTERHQEKKQNFQKIDQLKKKIQESKGNAEVDEREFNKLFNGGTQQQHGSRQNIIDRVKSQVRKRPGSKEIRKGGGGQSDRSDRNAGSSGGRGGKGGKSGRGGKGGKGSQSKRPGKVARGKKQGGRR